MTQTVTTATAAQVLRQPRFLRLWLAILFSGFGEWLAIMATFGIVTFQLRGPPVETSGVMISYILPIAFLGPVAGVFVDRWELRRTMLVSSLLRAVFVAALAFTLKLHVVYGLVFLASAVSTLFTPAQTVAIPQLVRQEELLVANALATQTQQLTKILGPAVAGLILARFSERTCFLAGAASFVLAAFVVAAIRLEGRQRDGQAGVRAMLHEIAAGLRFIYVRRAIFFVAVSMAVAMFSIGIFDSLVPVYVRDVLKHKTEFFGGVLAIVGAGTILGALLIGRYAQHVSRVLMVVNGIFLFGASMLAITLVSTVASTLAFTFTLGIGIAAVMVSSQTLLQEQVPGAMLGRVTSTGIALVTISQLVAFAAGGPIAGAIGIRKLFLAAAALLTATALYGYIRVRVDRHERS